jgi:hypothetical protein
VQQVIINIAFVVAFILLLPYSLILIAVIVLVGLSLPSASPRRGSNLDKKVERWSRKRKRYY